MPKARAGKTWHILHELYARMFFSCGRFWRKGSQHAALENAPQARANEYAPFGASRNKDKNDTRERRRRERRKFGVFFVNYMQKCLFIHPGFGIHGTLAHPLKSISAGEGKSSPEVQLTGQFPPLFALFTPSKGGGGGGKSNTANVLPFCRRPWPLITKQAVFTAAHALDNPKLLILFSTRLVIRRR